MKTVKATATYCDCGCMYCEYNEWQFEIECPYKTCGAYNCWSANPQSGNVSTIECEGCWREIEVKITFELIQ